MTTTIALGLGSLLLLTAFTVNSRTGMEVIPAFRAEIVGEVSARPSGTARFGVSGGAEGAPAVFTISLGTDGEEGSILFTRRSGARLVPGTYRISDRADGADDIRALVMAGSATRPIGVFQGTAGSLVVTSVGELEIRGTFRIDASGFLAAEPGREDRTVQVSGAFHATR